MRWYRLRNGCKLQRDDGDDDDDIDDDGNDDYEGWPPRYWLQDDDGDDKRLHNDCIILGLLQLP